MKRILFIFLSVCIIASLCSCGKKDASLTPLPSEVSSADTEGKPDFLLCTDIGWQIVENSPEENGERYVTFYNFHENGQCTYSYGYYFSDLLGSGNGTYTLKGDLLTVSLILDDITEPVVTEYKISAGEKGFLLTQESETGLFYYHEKGTVLSLDPHSDEFIPE